MKLTARDEHQLSRVHPDLAKVVRSLAASATMPFTVLEGARSKEQQDANIEAGVSWTRNSRHLIGKNGYAHAVDLTPLVNGRPSWDWAVYRRFAPLVEAAARSVGVPVEWGGRWKKTPDGPHWQLPRSPRYASLGGEGGGSEEECCGGTRHRMYDSELAPSSGPDGPTSTTPQKWGAAATGGTVAGGIGLAVAERAADSFGYGFASVLTWEMVAVLCLLAGLLICGALWVIGEANREKLYARIAERIMRWFS